MRIKGFVNTDIAFNAQSTFFSHGYSLAFIN